MANMTFIVKVSPDKQKEFLQAMRSIQEDRSTAKGIKGAKLYQDGEDRTGFTLSEEWETDKDLETHLNGESFEVFLGALRTLCTEIEAVTRSARKEPDGEGL